MRKDIFLRIIEIMIAIALITWCVLIRKFTGIFNLGSEVCVVIAVLLLINGIFGNLINKKLYESKAGRVCIKVIRIGVICAATLFFIESNLMLASALSVPDDCDTLIVLGSQVTKAGPSRMTACRLDAARDYLNAHPESVAVLSGGKGSNEPWSEAEGMRDYLVLKGINASRLYLEDKSTSTKENLIFSSEVIKENGLSDNACIVTNAFHTYRAGLIAKEEGFAYKTLSAKSFYFILPTYYFRELLAIAALWANVG